MIKRLVVILIAIIGSQTFAQQGGTASPYSFFGIGSLQFRGTVENRSMGGISVYSDSIHINLRNPAFYTGKNVEASPYNNESRPVKFAVAGSFNNLSLESASTSENANASAFDYIALTLPAGRFGIGFGLLPFTSVGYQLEDLSPVSNDLLFRYEGEGGLNKVFLGTGYQINNNLRVGVDVNYNFGNIQNSAIEFVYDDEGNLVQFQTRENNRSDLTGVNFNLGIAYNKKVTEKLELSATAAFSPESNLTSTNDRSLSTIVINGFTGAEVVQNTIDLNLNNTNLAETDLTLPSRLSFGAGIGESKHWFVGAEYIAQNTSEFDNPIFSTTNSSFEDASSISIGGFYIPNYNSFSKYLSRVVYRAGFRVENTGLVVNNESIDEFGISFGLGLPVGKPTGGLFSEINLGFEYGERGTTNQNLIREKFFNFNVSLSLSDRWFQKRKYN
ncbi:hypothetical protein [Winogradskyella immobilis]|uniref:Long-chain fatty acid transport protein n=1 Tax=Winogradskyella immobilis TaxID=2816852 RepID=A0ABS8EIY6_9FLAO|nr:hypothetical protein [Winogradskyella immobilis]MCC1483174.1 hypothetical protein [Winogradskyella immobilis]MCG0015269.1 hypothetical protein [Winogradskyella immobilis]